MVQNLQIKRLPDDLFKIVDNLSLKQGPFASLTRAPIWVLTSLTKKRTSPLQTQRLGTDQELSTKMSKTCSME